jgi:uncharacterized protein Yka (UPF0111/DUF47 family)
MFQIFPQNTVFFQHFCEQAALIQKAARQLESEAAQTRVLTKERAEQIHQLERDGDEVTRTALRLLVRSFITPLDREDIFTLVTALDDILDEIDELTTSMFLFGVRVETAHFRELCRIIAGGSNLLVDAFTALSIPKRRVELPAMAARIGEEESAGDRTYHLAIAELFAEGSEPFQPIDVFKWKELYDRAENIINAIQRVGYALEMVSLKLG